MSELKQILINYINKPKNDFRILFPIQTIGGALKKKRWFNIQNTKFIISDWKRIHELKGWQDFADHAKSIKYLASNLKEQIVPMHQYFSPLLVTARARNHSEAFHSTNRKYEVMRAILNLSYKHGQITLQAGPPQPLGAILPPIFYGIFDKNGNYINLYFNEEPYIYKKISLRQVVIENLNRILRRVSNMDEDLKIVFIDSLNKYVHALDTLDWRDAFLSLWQILENLSLSTVSKRMKMTDVCSRVKNLMGMKATLYKELVEALVETRNELVHMGKFSQNGLTEVNLLKVIVDLALSNFYWLSKKFPSKETMEEFFQIATLHENVLHRRKNIAESVIQLRKKSN